jgi:hypothetical protein
VPSEQVNDGPGFAPRKAQTSLGQRIDDRICVFRAPVQFENLDLRAMRTGCLEVFLAESDSMSDVELPERIFKAVVEVGSNDGRDCPLRRETSDGHVSFVGGCRIE